VLHPVHHLAVLRFLNGDVRHGNRWRSAVPMPHTGWKPDDFAGSDLLDGSTFDLHPAAASRDNEPLAERMRVPGRPGTRLERDAGCTRTSGGVWVEQGINADGAGEPISWSLDGGLRAYSFNFHIELLCLRCGGLGAEDRREGERGSTGNFQECAPVDHSF
jgi:hypothetical protein